MEKIKIMASLRTWFIVVNTAVLPLTENPVKYMPPDIFFGV